jgi:hypothetical protein
MHVPTGWSDKRPCAGPGGADDRAGHLGARQRPYVFKTVTVRLPSNAVWLLPLTVEPQA